MKVIYVNANNLQEVAQSAPNVAMALGFFDGIHLGHQKVIRTAKKKAEENTLSTAVLSFLQHPKSVLSSRAVAYLEPIEQKVEKLEEIGVDYFYIVEFTKELAKVEADGFLNDYIIGLKAKEIICGFDYSYGACASGNVQTLAEYANVHKVGLTVVEELKWNNQKISSTLIRNYLKERKIKELPSLIGDFYQTKYCQRDGLLANYSLPKEGCYKVLIRTEQTEIKCDVTVKCDQFVQFHHDMTSLPKLLTIKWLDSLDTNQRLVI